jgi:site-specific recombinase XerC
MMDDVASGPSFGHRWHFGPLAPHVDAFAARLSELGYARSTRRVKLRAVADFGRWLERRGVVVADVDEHIIVDYHRRCGRRRDSTTLADLLEALRSTEVARRPAPAPVECPRERVVLEFARYLVEERALSQASLDNSLPFVRSFLAHRFGAGPVALSDLRAPDVRRFLLRKVHTVGAGRAKLMVGALRSFFRFLRWRGDIVIDLASTVPQTSRRHRGAGIEAVAAVGGARSPMIQSKL